MSILKGKGVYKKIFVLLAAIILNSGCTARTSEELYADGVRMFREGNVNGAIVFFRKALDKDHCHLDARYSLARAYVSVRKYDLAEKEFKKVKLMNPDLQDLKDDLARLWNFFGKQYMAMIHVQESHIH